MPEALEIALTPERLDDAAPEERACFGRFTIETAAGPLTAGIDHFIGGYRAGPLVSGYHAAEWFAWNWWRLRYEPRSRAPEWWRAHMMSAIGEGYVWPRITIFSDGVRTTVVSEPSVRADAKPFRYLGAHTTVLPSAQFEGALDAFIGQMEGRLIEHGLADTNLSRIWTELRAERADPASAERRRLEALLAFDPDEAADDAIEALVADSRRFGTEGAEELAADQGGGGERLGGADLDRIAAARGVTGRACDAVRLPPGAPVPAWGERAAWVVGARAADELRSHAGLANEPISDARLAELAGVGQAILSTPAVAPLAFSLDRADGGSATVLRSRNPAGRRFELARLIGDRAVSPGRSPLHAATRAYTYRQKMQRSFAAELLCPFPALDGFLENDISPEAQQDAAEHFRVSELTVRTLLVNHGRLEREELVEDLDAAA